MSFCLSPWFLSSMSHWLVGELGSKSAMLSLLLAWTTIVPSSTSCSELGSHSQLLDHSWLPLSLLIFSKITVNPFWVSQISANRKHPWLIKDAPSSAVSSGIKKRVPVTASWVYFQLFGFDLRLSSSAKEKKLRCFWERTTTPEFAGTFTPWSLAAEQFVWS